jgi:hypothetical protein
MYRALECFRPLRGVYMHAHADMLCMDIEKKGKCHVYIYMYVYTRARTCIHTCQQGLEEKPILRNVYAHVCVCMCVSIYLHVCMHTYSHEALSYQRHQNNEQGGSMLVWRFYVYIHACMHTYVYTYIYIHNICIYIHTYIQAG